MSFASLAPAETQWTPIQPPDEPSSSRDLVIKLDPSGMTFSKYLVYCTVALRLLGGEGTVGVLVPTP